MNGDNSVNIETRLFKFGVLIFDIIIKRNDVSEFYFRPLFSFYVVKRMIFTQFIKYFAIFAIKKEPRLKIQNLKHGSLQMGLMNNQTKFETCMCYGP